MSCISIFSCNEYNCYINLKLKELNYLYFQGAWCVKKGGSKTGNTILFAQLMSENGAPFGGNVAELYG